MKTAGLHKALILVAAVSSIVCVANAGERYMERPVRIVVPFSPGGGTDLQARVLARKLRDRTGLTFIVENRTSGSGMAGIEFVAKSAPDGHTMVFATATLAANAALYRERMRFNPLAELTPITWFSSAPLVLVVHDSVPAQSVTELVAHAQRNPGLLSVGINVPGSTSHLSAEMLRRVTGIDVVLVPFRGGGPAMGGLRVGEIDLLFATAPVASPHLRAGRVRGLAVTTAGKSSAFPELPTMAFFYPGFEAETWYALFFPADTPRALVERMHSELSQVAQSDHVRAFMAKQGLDAVVSTPDRLAALLRTDIARYGNLSLATVTQP